MTFVLCVLVLHTTFLIPLLYSVAIWEAADGGAGHLEEHDNEDKSGPIRGQYSGHVICLDQSEDSIHVTLSVLANKRPAIRSHDLFRPIRGQY